MPRKNSDSHWFKFYPDKYLGGTGGFTLEMHGAYMLMLLHQWSSGAFSEDIARIKVGKVWDKISFKFAKTEKGFVNERMEIEAEFRRSTSIARTKSVLMRYNCTTTEVLPYSDSVSVSVSESDSNKGDTIKLREIRDTVPMRDREIPIPHPVKMVM